ncbi:MAG: hypothetical protein AABY87_00505 [bacterium]
MSSQEKELEKRIRPKTPAALRSKWRRWLPRLKGDVTDLYRKLQIYKELVSIVKADKKTLDPPAFFNWARDNYIVAICIGIRRLSDKDLDSISLRRLLGEVALRPDVVSRDSFRALHWQKDCTSRDADVSFDKIVGRGKSHVSAQMVTADVKKLAQADERIRRFVNKRLAHHVPLGQIRRFPTLSEVEEALEVFDELFAKYNMLISGDGFITLYATPQYDWRRVLAHAWMSNTPGRRPKRYQGPKHVYISF